MKIGTDSTKRPTFEQLGWLAGFIIEFLATLLSFDQIQYYFKHKNELKKKLREVFSIVDEFADICAEWERFYKEKFNWTVNFSMVIIPVMPAVGKWRLIFIPKGMTMNLAFTTATKFFKTWRYNDDLDAVVTKNIRNTENHYAIWVRDEAEPDKEFLGKSTRQADPDIKIGITLLERIIFEVKYFTETGHHLDVKGITFCSGSRDSYGGVPGASWSDDEFWVDWDSLDNYNSGYGIRSAVSL